MSGAGTGQSRAQRGIAVLGLLVLLAAFGSTVMLWQIGRSSAPGGASQHAHTTRALADAKSALVGWAAGNSDVPGAMPYPDRNGDGNYDGNGDCVLVVTDVHAGHLLGKLPWNGQAGGSCLGGGVGIGALRDGSGEVLWLAVSQNLVRGGDRMRAQWVEPTVNWAEFDPPGSRYPWLAVRGPSGTLISDRVAAVVIAPGAAGSGQPNRDRSAPDAVEFLDSITLGGVTYMNWDTDGCYDDNPGCGGTDGEDFIVHSQRTGRSATQAEFNDRLAFITVEELMSHVQRRVAAEIASVLRAYQEGPDHDGYYPWLSPFADPSSSAFRSEVGTREGHLAFHAASADPFRRFRSRITVSWNVDPVGANLVTRGTVSPADVLVHSRSSEEALACEWTRFDAVSCPGWSWTETMSGHPCIVRRTYALDPVRFTGHGPPTVTAPSAFDYRRRAVVHDSAIAHEPIPMFAMGVTVQDLMHVGEGCAERVVSGEGRLVVDNQTTTGSIVVSGLRYDLGVPNELPSWFVDNHWYELVYAAHSAGFVPPVAPAGCTEGVDCLVVYNVPATSAIDDKWAVVMSAGVPLSGQARPASGLEQYFELNNAEAGDDVFIRGARSSAFNDVVRIVAENRR